MNDEWETPDDLFDALHKEFNFKLDAAASQKNHKVPLWLGKDHPYWKDSLQESWATCERIWLNPPYSRGNIEAFMKKAYLEHKEGATVVCLVRHDPSAKWFQNYVWHKADQVRMLPRRVKFKGATSAYNFPCCIIVYEPLFNPNLDPRTKTFYWDWKNNESLS